MCRSLMRTMKLSKRTQQYQWIHLSWIRIHLPFWHPDHAGRMIVSGALIFESKPDCNSNILLHKKMFCFYAAVKKNPII